MATPSEIGAEEPAAGAAGLAAAAVDFFVSYTTADRPWAEWIAWELEHAGHSVVIQAWDFGPGSNFVLAMHEAAQRARRTITVLSPAFLQSPYCASEWAAALRVDPTGKGRKLVPVRVRECAPEGLLGSVVYVDVVGLSEAASRAALLAAVTEGRGKPVDAPAFPGTRRGVEGERVRRPQAGAAIFNVPVATRTFVGRHEQLRQLGEGLSGDGAVAITQMHAIHGMGGVGKTQLAARYARQQREGYDVIWWVRAEQQPTLRADLAGLAAALGLVDAEADEQDAITAAREWLEQHERWLLVFDNATGPDALAGLLPEGSGGHVLITSRTHADWRGLHATPLALDVWPRPEAIAFLRGRSSGEDRGVLDAVAGALGDLPLALEQAVAYASTQAITLSAYVDRLRDRAPRLFAAGRPAGYEHTVATVWQLAFEQVAKHPVAQQLLEVCAFLGSEGIPRELLEALADDSATAGISAEDVDDAIAVLLGYALLTGSVEGSFAMHRLVGQLAREHADTDTRRSAARLAVAMLAALWPERPWEHEHWPMCQRLLAHALTTTEHTQQLDAEHALTATLLARVGLYQQARAEYRPARQQLTRALAILEAVYGPEHPEVAATLTNLGNVQRQLGEFEQARDTQQRALAIKEAVYGPEQPEVAITLTNLGIVQAQLGEFEQARDTLTRALAINEAVYGPEHPEAAATLVHLGNTLRDLSEPERARDLQQRALSIETAIYGDDHHEVAATRSELARTLRAMGVSDR